MATFGATSPGHGEALTRDRAEAAADTGLSQALAQRTSSSTSPAGPLAGPEPVAATTSRPTSGSNDLDAGPPSEVARLLNTPLASARHRASAARQQGSPLPLSIEERLGSGDQPPIVVAASAEATPRLGPGDLTQATVSFYYCEQGDSSDGGDGGGFCGPMRDGTVVYEGAAACDVEYLGQRFRIAGDPTDRIYTCHDTGSAVHGLHRDIFFYSAVDGWPWLLETGTDVVLEIVE
ncbi:MAG: hypothetical protein O3A10_03930 [Chloroflexi bacterium]|nr:hypothetical protein [Chloroflexota bacterium]MDA1147282.1 hypothetical protein [Chloroflexota bacterium]